MDLNQKLRNVVRAIIGMPEDPGQPPLIDRLAWYEARVTSCASDGSTCDVQPFDPRIAGENGVQVLVGVPGAVAVVAPGATVVLGWERGDPARPKCMPLWEPGATVNKLTFNALALELAGNTYSLPQWDVFIAALQVFTGAVKIATTAAQIASAASTLDAAISSGLKSTKVKNG